MAVKFINPSDSVSNSEIARGAAMLPHANPASSKGRSRKRNPSVRANVRAHRNPAPGDARELHIIDHDREAVLVETPSDWMPGEEGDFKFQGPKKPMQKAAMEYAEENDLKVFVGNKRVNPAHEDKIKASTLFPPHIAGGTRLFIIQRGPWFHVESRFQQYGKRKSFGAANKLFHELLKGDRPDVTNVRKARNPSKLKTRPIMYHYHVTGPRGGKYLTSTFEEARTITKNGGTIRKLKTPRKG